MCKLGMEGDVLGGCFWQRRSPRRNPRRNPPRDEEEEKEEEKARENGVKALPLRIPRLMEGEEHCPAKNAPSRELHQTHSSKLL